MQAALAHVEVEPSSRAEAIEPRGFAGSGGDVSSRTRISDEDWSRKNAKITKTWVLFRFAICAFPLG
jgi:hypothetical protein